MAWEFCKVPAVGTEGSGWDLCYVMLCYIYFSSEGPLALKVPYWGTGYTELGSIYMLIIEYF